MPEYTNPDHDPTLEQLLSAVYKEVLEIKEIVLDLQVRQKTMDLRQQKIKTEIEEHEQPLMKGLYQKT